MINDGTLLVSFSQGCSICAPTPTARFFGTHSRDPLAPSANASRLSLTMTVLDGLHRADSRRRSAQASFGLRRGCNVSHHQPVEIAHRLPFDEFDRETIG